MGSYIHEDGSPGTLNDITAYMTLGLIIAVLLISYKVSDILCKVQEDLKEITLTLQEIARLNT
jgi:hypothetical protein